MKINGQVSLVRRQQPGASGRYGQATLAICKKPTSSKSDQSEIYLMVSTVQNPNWMKYKIEKNVKLFSKFANEGKCSIRLLEPPHDILVKNVNLIQLKSFISVLARVTNGDSVDQITFSQPPTRVEMPKTRMTIVSRKDYPSHGFPITLITLTISRVKLCAIPKALLKLVNLQTLDLSDNVLKEANVSLTPLTNLSELILCKNKLVKIDSFRLETLPNLTKLNLSQNELVNLPETLCESNLVELFVNNNKLSELPSKFGNMERLRNFTASQNNLTALPASLFKLKLLTLDLFGNPFTNDFIITSQSFQEGVPSLYFIAASVIVSKRIPYTPEDLPRDIIRYLKEVEFCHCGKPAPASQPYDILAKSVGDLSRSTILPQGFGHIPIRVKLCSTKCKLRLILLR